MKLDIRLSFLIGIMLFPMISFASGVAPNTLSNLSINIVPRQVMYDWCGRDDCHGCYYEGETYIANDLKDRTLWVLIHETCHHLQRNIGEYGGQIEENECNIFASYMVAGEYFAQDDETKTILNKVKLLIKAYWK